MPARKRARWFGSIRISQDGGLRFSPWTLPNLSHVGFWVREGVISVFCGGRHAIYLFLDDFGNRVDTACFVYLLTPEQLRDAVGELRRATGGLERWIVPALEWNSASSAVRDEHPDTFKIIPGLLKSCRDLPVAKKWQRVRAQYFANAEEARARREAGKAGQAKVAGSTGNPRKARK